jgi:tetratricopeptide (TPR) repeat protein/tRNA A-37 threonylcarbamoyl transferase component Bud32
MPRSVPSRFNTPLEHPLEGCLRAFELAWKRHAPGTPPPRWQDYLPPSGQPCSPAFLFCLLSADVECRIASGLPALLSEPYFEDERLQSAAIDGGLVGELVRREYRQRWQRGEPVKRQHYLERFPRLDEDLADLVPTLRCPSCSQEVRWGEEGADAAVCSGCGARARAPQPAASVVVPTTRLSVGAAAGTPSVVPLTTPPVLPGPYKGPPLLPASGPAPRRLGRYELGAEIAHGGMGVVFQARDPELHRHLAVKVLKPELADHPQLVRRFLVEARITGQLQHPGIVAVHDIGCDQQGLPFLVMKLVRGETLANLLRQRSSVTDDLPSWLGVFEQVCQAVAFAHSRRVIHRDLKPANIMVGRFQEVQVMDWGLAKVLAAPGEKSGEEQGEAEHSLVEALEEGVRTQGMLGSPPYMPPEQALGEWERVDERADVFALGGILCEMLTGRPPYTGKQVAEVMAKARRGAIEEAVARLSTCGAGRELIDLARECLSPEVEQRPQDAASVAQRVAAYQRGVQERLRQAEQQRLVAEARAAEERKRRRLAIALAAVVLLAGVVGTWLLQQQWARQHEVSQKALQGLQRARDLLSAGWQSNDLAKLKESKVEADGAAEIARSGAAAVQQETAAFQQEVEDRLDRAQKSSILLKDLLDISTPSDAQRFQRDTAGLAVMLQPSAEEQYAGAFRRRWPDLDIDKSAEGEIVARLSAEPPAVVEEVLAGLDAWMMQRRRQRPQGHEWRRLLQLAEQLDQSSQRRQLRGLLAGAWQPPLGIVASLTGAPLPWSALWELEQGERWRRLVVLRQEVNWSRQPVLDIVLLAQVYQAAGDAEGALRALRQAAAVRPNEVVLLIALARLLEERGHLAEAIENYRTARGLRPESGIALAKALAWAGRVAAGEEVMRDLTTRQPASVEAHLALAATLTGQMKLDEAEAACRKAIVLQPEYSMAHHCLGCVLIVQKRFAAAEAAFRKALALAPQYADASICLGLALAGQQRRADAEAGIRNGLALRPDNPAGQMILGSFLKEQKRLAEAEAAYRKAIALGPALPFMYDELGLVLYDQRKLSAAAAAYRKAIALQPEYPEAYNDLGNALRDDNKPVEAEAAYRKAIALKPDYAFGYNGLANALHDLKRPVEAEEAARKAIALSPDYHDAHNGLGIALYDQHKLAEAEAAFKKAIALRPDYAFAYNNLAETLYQEKKLPEAVSAMRKTAQLLPYYPQLRIELRRAERMLQLEDKLAACLAGKVRPASPQEGTDLARCAAYREHYRAAVRFYAESFQQEPNLADNRQEPVRYNAVCCAALAAAGKDKDANALGEMERTHLRQQALDWLRADLKAHTELLEKNKAAAGEVQQQLGQWLEDNDLSSVRSDTALAQVPEAERAAWKKVWAEVAALHRRCQQK